MSQKKKNYSAEKKELVIDLVEKCPHIYNKKLQAHHDRTAKMNSWEAIAKESGLGVEEVTKLWDSLRDQFSKHLRALDTPSGSGAPVSGKGAFHFAERMQFLKDHIVKRKTTGNVLEFQESSLSSAFPDTSQELEENSQNQSQSPNSELSLEGENLQMISKQCATSADPVNSSQETPSPSGRRSATVQFNQVQPPKRWKPLEKVEKELLSFMKETAKEVDGHENYALSLVPVFKRFDNRKFAKAKCEIDRILFEIEFGQE